ncbi:hypothetical protein THAOC_19981 [Thalassiosira oceanica]|uniref:Uncharacterized protein n=1 Tax=Thalassiosira oceanica TaxID=159749 RepID=K0S159_THAOC|nr:hypothetical protein THAOC_19981 [Thalassiosira oceanica]|eukprot:EJK59758.1 hypothetical protein THAOC_19981 [Thalassiosira oceanica]
MIRVRRHPSTAKPTTSTCHQAMSQSGRDSDSEDSNCICWDQKGLGTGPDIYLHRFGGGFPGPPLASMSQSLLEAGSSSDDSSCGSEDSKREGDSERTPPGNRSGNRGRKRKPTNLLCGEDESPATIGKFQRGRSPNYCDSIVPTTHSNAIFSTTDGSTKQGIDHAEENRETRLGRLDGALTCAATRPATTNGSTRRTLPNNDSNEFGNEEEDWDLAAIDRSVAMARNGQRRRGLGFSRDRPSVAMARNEEFGNEEEDWDLDAIDRSVATALARQSHSSHRATSLDLSDYNEDIFSSMKPEELAAIDERVESQYRRKLTMQAAAVSVKSDDDKPTSASVVVEKPYFFIKLMRFSSKRVNQDFGKVIKTALTIHVF